MWASEKITHVCADQPHLRNDLPALVERLNDEARAPKKVSNHMSYIPVVPARGGAEVAVKIYIYIRPFSSIELACAVRQPSPCVRAFCESGVLFHMSHVKLHFALHTSRCTLHTPPTHFTLHTSHFTLHISHFTLHTSQSTLHTSRTRPRTVVVVSKNMTCARPRCNDVNCQANTFLTLHIAFFTFHAPHFSLALHFNSSHLRSSHLISCLPICQLNSSWLFSCHLSAAQTFSSH